MPAHEALRSASRNSIFISVSVAGMFDFCFFLVPVFFGGGGAGVWKPEAHWKPCDREGGICIFLSSFIDPVGNDEDDGMKTGALGFDPEVNV